MRIILLLTIASLGEKAISDSVVRFLWLSTWRGLILKS
jgi:hypothetical protein